MAAKHPGTVALDRLIRKAQSHPGWRIFPAEGGVDGFAGAADLFLVTDSPLVARQPLYEAMSRLGLGRAHLTSVWKRLDAGCIVPRDCGEQLAFFRRECAALQPRRVVALGPAAYRALATHFPELGPRLASASRVPRETEISRLLEAAAA
jgi:hypothetical protein